MLAEQHTQLICCRVGEHNNLVNVGIHTCSPITRVLKTILNIIDLGKTFVNHLLPYRGPKLWNSLLVSITNSCTIGFFKRLLFIHYINCY